MRLRMAVGVCVMVLAAAVLFVGAAETPPDKPATKAPAGRLTQPWNKISSLSDEQKVQIRQIHGKAVAEMNAIRERETADIMALLTEEQKAEAQKLMDQQRKRRAAAREEPAKVEEKKSAPGE